MQDFHRPAPWHERCPYERMYSIYIYVRTVGSMLFCSSHLIFKLRIEFALDHTSQCLPQRNITSAIFKKVHHIQRFALKVPPLSLQNIGLKQMYSGPNFSSYSFTWGTDEREIINLGWLSVVVCQTSCVINLSADEVSANNLKSIVKKEIIC